MIEEEKDYGEHIHVLFTKADKEEFYRMFDSALDRWLDKQFARFGRWTMAGIGALVFAALLYFYVHTGGFFK